MVPCFDIPLSNPQIFYNSTEEAHNAAKRGIITSYIQFANNFTESMIDIQDNGRYADDSSFAGREIQIHLDMTGNCCYLFYDIYI